MSWSVQSTGTKEAVKSRLAEQLDKIADSYAGKAEADDVKACKDRILALVDACALGQDANGFEWNAVKVTAFGSHGTTSAPVAGITTGSFSVSVERTSLAL